MMAFHPSGFQKRRDRVKKTVFVVALLLLSAPVIAEAQCLLTTETESLPAFFIGEPANFQIVAVSGTEPYRYNVHEGTLPEGLHLTPNGKIVGVPRVESESVVLITVTDDAGCTLTQAYNFAVFP
jgi:Putative Ig domain